MTLYEKNHDERKPPLIIEQISAPYFARIDKSAFGIAVGCVSGTVVFLFTLWLVIKGDPNLNQRLEWMGQYFFGYAVSVKGAVWGFCHGFIWGFLFGGLFAYLCNFTMATYILWLNRKSDGVSFRDFLDHI